MVEGTGNAPLLSRSPSTLRFGSFLDSILEGLQVLDLDWRYLYVNEALCRQVQRSREELLGRRLMEVHPGIERTAMFPVLERSMKERTAAAIETHVVVPGGVEGSYELRVEPVPEGLLILSLDASERTSQERLVRQASKMEAIGRLAGRVAHDLNNILTAIQSFGRLAIEHLDDDGPAHSDLAEVLNASERAETLVRQLLAFSQKNIIEPRTIDVNAFLDGLSDTLGHLVGDEVEVRTTEAADLGQVHVDPAALQQVLVNLAVNARDAMSGRGRLSIETANATLDETYSMAKGDVVEPGDYVVIAMTDEGVGLDAKARSRLFEPFFTTKKSKKGAGLGLSTSYGIVRQAGGYIWVYSEPGSGTTFKIYLPRVAIVPKPTATEPGPALSGTESVLVVEDDPQVRRLVVRVLGRLGYRILEASSGATARKLAREAGSSLQLLLTDVVMPEVSGRELARSLAEMRPGLRVLFMSGYTENAMVDNGILEPGIQLLEKPFTPERLARKVRSVLDD